MPGVKWILSPGHDGHNDDAYAACRTILALQAAGASLTVELLASPEDNRASDAETIRVTSARIQTALGDLIDRVIDYDKVVLRLDPTRWPQFRAREAGSYLIGAASWETLTLPIEWIAGCKAVDEVWVPTPWEAEIFLDSGALAPVLSMPPCTFDTLETDDIATPIDGLAAETWVFYSILDGSERSNAADLVVAYLAAFSGVRDVVLALARSDLPAGSEQLLKSWIRQLKDEIQLPHYPRIITVAGRPDFHARGDCFVHLSRGGGWDYHRFEAAARGKPVLACQFGDAEHYLNEACAYPVPVTLRPVENMQPSPLHHGTQLWAQPDLGQTVRLLRQIYENRRQAQRKGALAAEWIAKNHAQRLVASLLLRRFEEIAASRS